MTKPTPRTSRWIGAIGWIALASIPLLGVAIARNHHPSVEDEAPAQPGAPAVLAGTVLRSRVRPAARPPERTTAPPPATSPPTVATTKSSEALAGEADFLLVLRSNPDDVEALEGLASLYSDRQADDAAHELAAHCLAVDPDNASCAQLQLRSSMRQGEFEAARREVQTCLRLAPRNGTCLYGDSMLRATDGDLDGAQSALDELREAEGESTMAHVLAAVIARPRGNPETELANLSSACSDGQEWACNTLANLQGGDRDSLRMPAAATRLLAMHAVRF